MGKVAPLLHRRADPGEFCRTKSQVLAIALCGAAPAAGLLGAVLMLRGGEWLWPSWFLASALAFVLPHPSWVCRYCAQRERGPCPVGQALVQVRAR